MNKKNCKIIIGSDGLIGSELAKSIKSQNIFTVSKKKKKAKNHFHGNLENLSFIKKIYNNLKKKYKKFTIFYLAGHSRVKYNKERIRNLSLSSVIKLTNILDIFKGSNIKIILSSSGSVYLPSNKPLKESSKVCPLNFYSTLKIFEENIALEYLRNYKTKVVIARIFSIISNSKNFFLTNAKQKLTSKKKKLVFYGSGYQARDYTHISDVCFGLNILAKRGKTGQIYNICSGKYHYLKNILKLINKEKNNNKKVIIWNKINNYYENDFWYGSNYKIRKLGYKYKLIKQTDFL